MFALFWKVVTAAPFTRHHANMDWSRPGTSAARNTMPW